MTGADSGAGPGGGPRWDVVLSFAGAQRDYVGQVGLALQARGLRCVYDADEQVDLSMYLAEELPAMYGGQAAVMVVFVSAEYAAGNWTRLERRAALDRALRERREDVLAARFDDARLPGLWPGTVVDVRGWTPQQLAAMIAAKLVGLGLRAAAGEAAGLGTDIGPEQHSGSPSDAAAAQVPQRAHTLIGRTGDAHAGWVYCVAFSPDGALLASGGADKTVRLWDPATGKHLRTLAGHKSVVRGVAFSPDARWLASAGGGDSTVRLWDPATGEHLRTLAGHRPTARGVTCVAFSPDARYLASGAYDMTVRLWNPATGKHLVAEVGHYGGSGWVGLRFFSGVTCVGFSPDGRWLASGGADKTVACETWKGLPAPAAGRTLADIGAVRGVAFSPDGMLLASGGRGDSTVLRIPIESDHLFRSNPIADSGVSDHLAGVGVS
jgi:hypothetical protein